MKPDETSEVEKILRKLDRGEYLGEGGVDGAIDALSALIGECIPEKSPKHLDLYQHAALTYSGKELSKEKMQAWDDCIDTIKDNLRKRGLKI